MLAEAPMAVRVPFACAWNKDDDGVNEAQGSAEIEVECCNNPPSTSELSEGKLERAPMQRTETEFLF